MGTVDQQPLHAAGFSVNTLLSFSRSVAYCPPVWQIHRLMTLQLPHFAVSMRLQRAQPPIRYVSMEKLITYWCCVSELLSPGVRLPDGRNIQSVVVGFGTLLNCRICGQDASDKHTHTFSEAFPIVALKEQQLLFNDQRLETRINTRIHTHTHYGAILSTPRTKEMHHIQHWAQQKQRQSPTQ